MLVQIINISYGKNKHLLGQVATVIKENVISQEGFVCHKIELFDGKTWNMQIEHLEELDNVLLLVG